MAVTRDVLVRATPFLWELSERSNTYSNRICRKLQYYFTIFPKIRDYPQFFGKRRHQGRLGRIILRIRPTALKFSRKREILYEIFAGTVVFQGKTSEQLKAKQIERQGTAAAQKQIDGQEPKSGQDEAGKKGDDVRGTRGGAGRKATMMTAEKAGENSCSVEAPQGQQIEESQRQRQGNEQSGDRGHCGEQKSEAPHGKRGKGVGQRAAQGADQLIVVRGKAALSRDQPHTGAAQA